MTSCMQSGQNPRKPWMANPLYYHPKLQKHLESMYTL
jgi:hypothetical protein